MSSLVDIFRSRTLSKTQESQSEIYQPPMNTYPPTYAFTASCIYPVSFSCQMLKEGFKFASQFMLILVKDL